MLSLAEIPAIREKVLKEGRCALEITTLSKAETLDQAWALLPDSGTGVVVCADRVERFDPGKRNGLLLEAEVCDGNSTTIVRSRGNRWDAWRWTQKDGDTHRWIEYRFLSTEAAVHPSRHIYRQYWIRVPSGKDEVLVWQPIGARFCGFEEDSKA
jgi:hypothetical protein